MSKRAESGRKGKSGPELAGDVARRLIRGKVGRRRRKESRIVEAWEKIAGPDLATRMFPQRLRAGVLWVEVDSPTLYYEVAQFKAQAILDRVRESVPDLDVKEVRFKLGG